MVTRTRLSVSFIRTFPVLLKPLQSCILKQVITTTTTTTILFFYWRYNPLWVCILQPSSGAIASSLMRFLDHTK